MNEKILIIDDEIIILDFLETLLSKENYNIKSINSPIDALQLIEKENFDLVISDYFMPLMNGKELLIEIRKINKDIPIIILTVNRDISRIIELFRYGASDYLLKPIIQEELLNSIKLHLNLAYNKKIVERVEKEKKIIELENKKITNWRLLYAYKETRNIDQTLSLLKRNMNQTGGFIWLDNLKSNIEQIDENHYKVDKLLIDLIIEVSERNKEIYNIIDFISSLDELNLNFEIFSFIEFYNNISFFIVNEMKSIVEKYGKKIIIDEIRYNIKKSIEIDITYFNKVLKELIINAIKYSEENSIIQILFNINNNFLELTVRNIPREMNAVDLEGNKIKGIPYDYSELVFDLFFTIEPYLNRLQEEEWYDGSGLYISRKLLSMMNCVIRNSNGIDYSQNNIKHFLNTTISIPLI